MQRRLGVRNAPTSVSSTAAGSTPRSPSLNSPRVLSGSFEQRGDAVGSAAVVRVDERDRHRRGREADVVERAVGEVRARCGSGRIARGRRTARRRAARWRRARSSSPSSQRVEAARAAAQQAHVGGDRLGRVDGDLGDRALIVCGSCRRSRRRRPACRGSRRRRPRGSAARRSRPLPARAAGSARRRRASGSAPKSASYSSAVQRGGSAARRTAGRS